MPARATRRSETPSIPEPEKFSRSAESIAPGMPQDREEAASSSDKLTISYQKSRFNAHFPQKGRGRTVENDGEVRLTQLQTRSPRVPSPLGVRCARHLHADSVCLMIESKKLLENLSVFRSLFVSIIALRAGARALAYLSYLVLLYSF